jgi:hypothetical protein
MGVKVDVELSFAYRPYFPHSKFRVDFPGDHPDLRQLLDRLHQASDGRIVRLLFEEDGTSVLSGLMVMINDRVYTGNEINRENVGLHDGDRVELLYFISGG